MDKTNKEWTPEAHCAEAYLRWGERKEQLTPETAARFLAEECGCGTCAADRRCDEFQDELACMEAFADWAKREKERDVSEQTLIGVMVDEATAKKFEEQCTPFTAAQVIGAFVLCINEENFNPLYAMLAKIEAQND